MRTVTFFAISRVIHLALGNQEAETLSNELMNFAMSTDEGEGPDKNGCIAHELADELEERVYNAKLMQERSDNLNRQADAAVDLVKHMGPKKSGDRTEWIELVYQRLRETA